MSYWLVVHAVLRLDTVWLLSQCGVEIQVSIRVRMRFNFNVTETKGFIFFLTYADITEVVKPYALYLMDMYPVSGNVYTFFLNYIANRREIKYSCTYIYAYFAKVGVTGWLNG